MNKIITVFIAIVLCFNIAIYAEVGVTDEEIRIGVTNVTSGPSAALGIETNKGFNCIIKSVNEKGGIYGRKLKVIFYDDKYEPIPCVNNVKKLIEEDKVFCLACFVGTPTSVKAQPIWTAAKVPAVGFFTGAEGLRKPFNKYNIHIRASYQNEVSAAMEYFVKELGIKKIAVFYQYDAFGETVKKCTENALQRYGLQPCGYGSFQRGTLEIEEGLKNVLSSNPEAVVIVGTYGPLAKFVKEAKGSGLGNAYFYTVSFVGPEKFAAELGLENEKNVIVSQVVPPYDEPGIEKEFPVVEEYLTLLKKYFPNEKPSFGSLEGFVNGKILVEGLKRAGKDLTREKFISAIESIKPGEMKTGLKVSYSPTDHEGIDVVILTKIVNGKYVRIK